MLFEHHPDQLLLLVIRSIIALAPLTGSFQLLLEMLYGRDNLSRWNERLKVECGSDLDLSPFLLDGLFRKRLDDF